jgi:D-glycero-D-manno-heptose 1,7-bisphosphate phosphatase
MELDKGEAGMSRGAFFLDRDGTINVDHVYINDPARIELIPGSGAAVARVSSEGFAVVVVTNQSGVGRGIIRPEALPRIHARMEELLAAEGARVDGYGICVHSPEEGCDCRKPSPRLVLEAAQRLDLDLSRSVFIGDKLTDVATGKRSGCRYSILIRSGKGAEEERMLSPGSPEGPDFVATDLAAAVDWALASLSCGGHPR